MDSTFFFTGGFRSTTGLCVTAVFASFAFEAVVLFRSGDLRGGLLMGDDDDDGGGRWVSGLPLSLPILLEAIDKGRCLRSELPNRFGDVLPVGVDGQLPYGEEDAGPRSRVVLSTPLDAVASDKGR